MAGQITRRASHSGSWYSSSSKYYRASFPTSPLYPATLPSPQNRKRTQLSAGKLAPGGRSEYSRSSASHHLAVSPLFRGITPKNVEISINPIVSLSTVMRAIRTAALRLRMRTRRFAQLQRTSLFGPTKDLGS